MRKREEMADPISCLNKAGDDEQLFVLLGRDKAAPDAVLEWVRRRIELGLNKASDAKIVSAYQWAWEVAGEGNMRTVAGFTGTRFGMNSLQLKGCNGVLRKFLPKEFWHGDCSGADAQAAAIAAKDVKPRPLVVALPGMDKNGSEDWRSHCAYNDVVMEAWNHFARNRKIVDACQLLIVAPVHNCRQERGGTWYTYDYAMKVERHTVVLWPDREPEELHAPAKGRIIE